MTDTPPPARGAHRRPDTDPGTEADGLRGRWKRRRARKKARLAGMTRKRRIWRRVGIASAFGVGAVAILLIITVVAFYQLSNVPRPEDMALPQRAAITYADGSTMATVGEENRKNIPLSQVPQDVRWAVIAAEDRSFYSDAGFSVTGTLRAAWNDLTGGSTQGGSGITQQYVKNVYLNSSQTLSRKLKELAISVKLAREYPKDQILEYYLNTVYFGRGAYGIEAAAETYFGVPASKLNVSQGALLAGMLRSPSYYDPANDAQAAKDRWNYVLDGMVQIKHLDPGARASLQFPKTLPPNDRQQLGATGTDAFIVNRVYEELAAHGISKDDIFTRGMVIKTTVDPAAQKAAEKAIADQFGNLSDQQKNLHNALVAVNPSDGAVLAYYGGTNDKDYSGKADYVDYAGTGFRPPGSSFKPYTLATALTQNLQGKSPGYAINSLYTGAFKTVIAGTPIQNDPSDEQYSSPKVSLANAMKYSLNTTFDTLANEVGPNNVAAMAHAAGVAATNDGKPTLADPDGQTKFGIGIGDYPVHPIDQAVGFATFADNGVEHDAWFVQSVTDSTGAIVYQHSTQGRQAMDPRVANDVTLTMEPIAQWSAVPLSDSRVSASKTGTEGVVPCPNTKPADIGGNSDAWMVGFTPQVSTAVWVGSGNSCEAIHSASGGQEYGRDLPGKTWREFMDLYLANKPKLPMATKQMIQPRNTSTYNPNPVQTRAPVTSARPSTSSATPTPTTSAPTTTSAPPTPESTPPTTQPSTSQPPSTSSSPSATVSIPATSAAPSTSTGPKKRGGSPGR